MLEVRMVYCSTALRIDFRGTDFEEPVRIARADVPTTYRVAMLRHFYLRESREEYKNRFTFTVISASSTKKGIRQNRD